MGDANISSTHFYGINQFYRPWETNLIRIFLLLIFLNAQSWAASPPPLERTRLYTSIASSCTDVNFSTWNHPTKQVLIAKGAQILRVQLCNNEKYPIFHVDFPYDPQGETKDYFLPLYGEMRKANGGWPYAFVARADNTIVYVQYGPNNRVTLAYEMYALP